MNKIYTLFLTMLLCFSANAQVGTLDWSQTTGETSVFSSARAVDLNADGVKDMVIGGGLESVYIADGSLLQYDSEHMVQAIDGATGEYLWQVAGPDQIFGSPIFRDVTGDFVPDVFIGGRNGFLMCINGSTGEVAWQYYAGSNGQDASLVGLYNFYNPQWIDDQNGDNIPDLLVSNGGDRSLPAWETNRPPGKLMVINPMNGALLASATMPDGKETYMSALVYDFFNDGKPDVIFGTGGETIGGNLYRAPLSDLMDGSLANATILLTTDFKGFIAPPSLADLNQDNIPEIITNTYDGHIIALDGWTNETLWDVTVPGAETNASPAIGLFTDDDIPDVFTSFLIGVAPSYTDVKQLMIDGATGELVYENDLGDLQYSSPVIYDTNSDGRDEAISMVNIIDGGNFYHDVIVFDFANGTEESLLDAPVGGTNIASTPWLGNLDNDGILDLFFAHNSDETSFNNEDSFTFKKYSLGVPDSNAVAWGAYMGNDGTGFYDNPQGTCFDGFFNITEAIITPACADSETGEIDVDSNGCPCMFNDCVFSWYDSNFNLDDFNTTHHAYGVSSGIYYVHIVHENGCVMVKRIEVEDATEPNITINNNICNGGTGGYAIVPLINVLVDTTLTVLNEDSVFVDVDTTIVVPIQWDSYLWSNGATTPNITGLSAGDYSVEVVAPNGDCSHTIDFEVTEPDSMVFIADIGEISCTGELDGTLYFGVEGGVGPYTLQLVIDGGPALINPFQAEYLVDGLAPGIYDYSVNDLYLCETFTGTFELTNPEPFNINSFETADIQCGGSGNGMLEMNATGGTGIYQLDLYNETTDENISVENLDSDILLANLTGGNWAYQLLDDNGCGELEGTFTIEEPVVFIAEAIAGDPVCFGELGEVIFEWSGGSGPYSFDIADVAYFEEEAGSIPVTLAPGSYNINFMDANNCFELVSFEINEPLPLEKSTAVDDIQCAGETGSFTVDITGGTPPYFYSLDGDNYTEVEEASYSAEDQAPGTYTVYFADANFCVIESEITLSEIMPLEVTVTTTEASDIFSSDGMIEANITGGTPPYTYDLGGVVGTNEAEGMVTADGFFVGEYTLAITDANDCSTTLEMASITTTDFGVTGLEDLELQKITLSPNPNKGQFVLEGFDANAELNVIIYNTIGQKIAFESNVMNGQTMIKMNDIQSGVYLVEVSNGAASRLMRVVVL